MSDLDERILDISDEIHKHFWDVTNDLTKDFPDISNSSDVKLSIIQMTITTLFTNYLLLYPKSCRSNLLEDIVEELRQIEINFRDTN